MRAASLFTVLILLAQISYSAEVKTQEWPKYPGSLADLQTGQVDEIEAGTVFEDGLIAGEREALIHIAHFEKSLYEKLKTLSRDQFRNRYAKQVFWFQRLGNYRKGQKCAAIQKLQTDLNLKATPTEKCVDQIMSYQ